MLLVAGLVLGFWAGWLAAVWWLAEGDNDE